MSAWLSQAWLKVKKWMWLVVAGLAFVIGIIITVLLRKKPDPEKPSFAANAAEAAEKLEDEIKVKKAEAAVQTEADKRELESIKSTQDPVEKRRKVAEFLMVHHK